MIGWGIGVVAHVQAVAGLGDAAIKRWEERKIREFMDHDRAADHA